MTTNHNKPFFMDFLNSIFEYLLMLLEFFKSSVRIPEDATEFTQRKEFRIILRKQLPKGLIEIFISDDLKEMQSRCSFGSITLEREQSPLVSIFADEFFPKLLNVESYKFNYLIHYRSVDHMWFRNSGVWAPTLDSYYLVNTVVNQYTKGIDSIWDVGTGTGIIGLIISSLTSCKETVLTDIDNKAIAHTKYNSDHFHNFKPTIRIEKFPPENVNQKCDFDLLVCNPPYFSPNFLGIDYFRHQATDEFTLTKSIIEKGPSYAKRVVFGFSSVLQHEVLSMLSWNRKLRGIDFKILLEKRLPLSIYGIQKPTTLPQGIFSSGPNSRFKTYLWHDLYICELSKGD